MINSDHAQVGAVQRHRDPGSDQHVDDEQAHAGEQSAAPVPPHGGRDQREQKEDVELARLALGREQEAGKRGEVDGVRDDRPPRAGGRRVAQNPEQAAGVRQIGGLDDVGGFAEAGRLARLERRRGNGRGGDEDAADRDQLLGPRLRYEPWAHVPSPPPDPPGPFVPSSCRVMRPFVTQQKGKTCVTRRALRVRHRGPEGGGRATQEGPSTASADP